MVDRAGGGEGAVTPAFPRWGEGGSAEPDEGRPYGGSPLMGKPPGPQFYGGNMFIGCAGKLSPHQPPAGGSFSPKGEAKVVFII